MNYYVPALSHETVFEIKKSRFIARASFADSRESAMAALEDARKAYPDARHHCWAYIIGNPVSPATVAMADDGEPAGTAGKPVLNVLGHKGVGDVMLVVSRYFGRIKLGAGGLVRAYSNAAQQTMEQLSLREQVFLSTCRVATDFKHEQYFRHWAQQNQAIVESCEYTQLVEMEIRLPEHLIPQLVQECERLRASCYNSHASKPA